MKPHEIRAAMVLAQVKIKDIAERVGHHPPAVHQVINNERPNQRIREAISEAIGKPVEEIWPDKKAEEQAA